MSWTSYWVVSMPMYMKRYGVFHACFLHHPLQLALRSHSTKKASYIMYKKESYIMYKKKELHNVVWHSTRHGCSWQVECNSGSWALRMPLTLSPNPTTLVMPSLGLACQGLGRPPQEPHSRIFSTDRATTWSTSSRPTRDGIHQIVRGRLHVRIPIRFPHTICCPYDFPYDTNRCLF
jgi:hypothetical protein